MRVIDFVKKTAFSSISVFSAALILFSAAAAQEKVSVTVAADSVVAGETIRLGDVARVEAGARTEKLRAVSLGYAPNVGAAREIARGQIETALAAAGFSGSGLRLDAPVKAIVRRAGQTIGRERLQAFVETELLAVFAAQKIEARLARFDAPDQITAPLGEIEIRTTLSGVQNFFQPFALPLEIRAGGKTVRRVAARVEIEAYAEVLTAARELAPGARVAAGAVRPEKIRLSRPVAAYFLDAEKLRGRTPLKTISAGTPLTVDAFVASVVVKAGDAVRIEAASGRVKIIVAGEARAAGKVGDRIAVKNAQSGAVIQAFVVDEGRVRVDF